MHIGVDLDNAFWIHFSSLTLLQIKMSGLSFTPDDVMILFIPVYIGGIRAEREYHV